MKASPDQPPQRPHYYRFLAVGVAHVHLFTLFMIVPIFNSMARIDKSLLEAAVDAGASRWGVIPERGAAAPRPHRARRAVRGDRW